MIIVWAGGPLEFKLQYVRGAERAQQQGKERRERLCPSDISACTFGAPSLPISNKRYKNMYASPAPPLTLVNVAR
jgi:hypothetical protein